MLFASTIFLLAFLPAAVLCYYTQKVLTGNRFRNITLLLFSYLFYVYGAAGFILLLILSTAADFFFALLIANLRKYSKLWVACSLMINLGLLAYFKYTGFIIEQICAIPGASTLPVFRDGITITLPIGISFFTFQKISYIIDVYRGQVRALTRPVDFALYVAMFPQLVAGPIVRFKDIWNQLRGRTENWHLFYTGVIRFIWGLSKKVLIADACGRIADVALATPVTSMDTKTAWLGAVAYTFQIYFDFSAYSDMAIGLARMFGFNLLENFNRPYAAVSMTDFWRRWHISLSNWFRDYLYIPLGGNRKSSYRTALNLILVFVLCGLWHGANWTFIIWGLYHGLFLGFERVSGFRTIASGRWIFIRRTITFLIVVFGWVLFRADHITAALAVMKAMIVPTNLPVTFELIQVLNYRNLLFFVVAVLSVIGASRLPTIEQLVRTESLRLKAASVVLVLFLLPYCIVFIMSGTSNPFIYYRF